jgi:sodium-coupled neutral amino acid transporter 11
MAKARSNGATTAHHNEPGAGNEEDIGLLAAGLDGSDDEDAVIVHPDELAGEGDYFTSASPTSGAPATPLQPHLDPQTPRTPRTPRTPNRVRFDLVPTIVGGANDPPANGRPADHHHYAHARDSFDVDDEDPLADSPRQHRVPLLTGIEAPSVTLASDDSVDLSRAQDLLHRPRSGLSSAFMNMANSIIGAGIIGQPYAFRQAGLISGIVLLVGLTVVVDWTIRLIVVNSKLSGSSSFQGTVEKCFGKTGLIAISLAQWVFAFGGMVAFGVIVGDTIPHVLSAIWPGLRDVPVLGALAGRKGVIVIFLLGVSYPLTLYRDIAKVCL